MTDNVVGSAAFELRATKDKIPADLEEARRVVLEAVKKTEDELAGVVGSGTEKGSKKAAAALKEPKAAGEEAGKAIRDAMGKAGAEIGEAVTKGATKAKQELDELARKAREVQQIRLATPTVPTEATHRLVTNPINGVQSWVPKLTAGAAQPSPSEPSTAVPITPGLQEVADAAGKLKDALDGVKPSAESTAEGLGKIDTSALLTGVSIGALIGGAIMVTKTMWDMGRAAMQAAGEISDSAKKIGVSTDTLQEFRYIATKIGEGAGAADQALGSFAEKLASAASRLSKEDVKSFGALLLDPDDLKKFKSTEEALDEVIDRIGNLKSETDRAAIAEKLGLGPLVVALRGGSDEIARLRDEAQTLGVVMDAELVRRGADAQSQFETLSRVIDVQLKSAFIDLAPAIVTVIGLVAQLGRVLNEYLDLWRDYDSKTTRGLQGEAERLSRENNNLIARYGSRLAMVGQDADRPTVPGATGGAAGVGGALVVQSMQPGARDTFENNQRRLAQIFEELKQREASSAPPPRQDNAGGTSLVLPPARERVDRSAEREARRAERVQEEINRAKARALQIAQDDLLTVQEQYDLRQRELAIERAGEDADLKSRLARKDLLQGEYEQLTSQNAINRALEDRIGKDILSRDLADERLAQERLIGDLTRDLLSLQSGAARTAAERRQIELQLLELAQDRARKELLNSDEYRKASPEEKAAAIAAQDQVFGWQVSAVNRSTMSPLEEWRDRSLNDAKEVEEAYERVAANGLDALNDGLVDAIMNSRSLGETFSQVAKQILADLLSISVRRGITEPLAGLLFGGDTGGSGGGLFAGFGSWLKGKIPGFSSGVTNFSGGLAYVHQGEVLANLAPGTDVIPAHAVGGMGGGGPVRVIVETNDDRFNAYVDNRVAPQASAAFTGARQTVPSDMARTSKYTLSGRR